MKLYPFQPLTKAHRTSGHYLDTYIKTTQTRQNINTLHGRILDTGINFIVLGYNNQGQWQAIPCHNISTAKLYLGSVMDEAKWNSARIQNKI